MKILVVDDSDMVLDTLRGLFEREGHEVQASQSPSIYGEVDLGSFDAIVSDYDFGLFWNETGVEALIRVQNELPWTTKVIILSGLDRDAPGWITVLGKDRLLELLKILQP